MSAILQEYDKLVDATFCGLTCDCGCTMDIYEKEYMTESYWVCPSCGKKITAKDLIEEGK